MPTPSWLTSCKITTHLVIISSLHKRVTTSLSGMLHHRGKYQSVNLIASASKMNCDPHSFHALQRSFCLLKYLLRVPLAHSNRTWIFFDRYLGNHFKEKFHENSTRSSQYVEIKCQLDATDEFFIVCPVCGLLPANRTHNHQPHTIPTTWKPSTKYDRQQPLV
jgi:hypothetical protein